MLYYHLKTLHIILGSVLLSSLIYSFALIKNKSIQLRQQLLFVTLFIFIPLAIFELLLGSSIISIQHYAFSSLWVKGTFISFSVMVISWLGFIYFSAGISAPLKKVFSRLLLGSSIISFLSLIFFMSTKVGLIE